jgi:hypothetical protein
MSRIGLFLLVFVICAAGACTGCSTRGSVQPPPGGVVLPARSGGEPGVSHALSLLRVEMERAMTLLGCHSLDELGPHLIKT